MHYSGGFLLLSEKSKHALPGATLCTLSQKYDTVNLLENLHACQYSPKRYVKTIET